MKELLATFSSSASHKFIECGDETARTFIDVTALFFAVHVNGEKLRGLISVTVIVEKSTVGFANTLLNLIVITSSIA